jgi:NAD(P)-dependent dehydrogenase (short-subunit alcohol dehydrogenase family)
LTFHATDYIIEADHCLNLQETDIPSKLNLNKSASLLLALIWKDNAETGTLRNRSIWEGKMDFCLKGKVALVTGAGSQIGFGKAIALTLAGEGCDVIVTDIDLKGAGQTAAAVEALGRKALALKADVTRNAEVVEMVKTATKTFGKIDILVNNAGHASAARRFVEKTEAEWDFDINLNLKGVLNCTSAVLPQMLSRKSGKIVNVASGAGRTGLIDRSTYSAAKGGVIAFTKALAKEVAASGINVNCVAPFAADTNFIRDRKDPGEYLKRAVSAVPLGRATTPQDVANAVAFFVSEVSSYVEGQTLSLNGGASMD